MHLTSPCVHASQVVCSDTWGAIAERELAREGVPYEMWTLDFMRELNKGSIRMASTKYR